eukprot:jgi/Hompol1/6444/HPOL_001709-RA
MAPSQPDRSQESQISHEWSTPTVFTPLVNRDELVAELRPYVRHNAVSIAAASAAGFDSLKTRMQAFKYKSSIDAITRTYREEGIVGFYRGVLPTLTTVSVLRAAAFSLYYGWKSNIVEQMPTTGPYAMSELARLSASSFLAGSMTGVCLVTLSAPIELIKVEG